MPRNACSLPRDKRKKDKFLNAFTISITVDCATTSVEEIILVALVNVDNRCQSGETPDSPQLKCCPEAIRVKSIFIVSESKQGVN